MSFATRFALSLAFMALLVVAGLALDYGLTLHALSMNNSHWCDTLNLLTSVKVPQPPNPGANPSREQAYLLFDDFVRLHSQFGCK